MNIGTENLYNRILDYYANVKNNQFIWYLYCLIMVARELLVNIILISININ